MLLPIASSLLFSYSNSLIHTHTFFFSLFNSYLGFQKSKKELEIRRRSEKKMAKFSGPLLLTDLNDFISPAQACIMPTQNDIKIEEPTKVMLIHFSFSFNLVLNCFSFVFLSFKTFF